MNLTDLEKLGVVVAEGTDAEGNKQYRATSERAYAYLGENPLCDENGKEIKLASVRLELEPAEDEEPAEEKDADESEGDKPEEKAKNLDGIVRRAVADAIKPLAERRNILLPSTVPAVPVASRGKLRAFKDPEAAYGFGCWIASQLKGGQFESLKRRSANWLKNRGLNTRATMTTGTQAGGAMIPEQFVGSLFNLSDVYGVYSQVARNVPMSSGIGRAYYPTRRSVGTAASVYSEAGTVSDSALTRVPVELVCKNFRGSTRFTRDLNDDTLGAVADEAIFECVMEAKRLVDNRAFASTNTDGINGLGRLLLDSSSPGVVAGGATIGAITRANLVSVESYVLSNPEAHTHISDIKWVMNYRTYRTLKELDNVATYDGTKVIAIKSQEEKGNWSLMGYPVVISDEIPSTGTSSVAFMPAYFGLFDYSCFYGERMSESSILVSEELYAASNEIGVFLFLRAAVNNVNGGDSTASGPVGGISVTPA